MGCAAAKEDNCGMKENRRVGDWCGLWGEETWNKVTAQVQGLKRG